MLIDGFDCFDGTTKHKITNDIVFIFAKHWAMRYKEAEKDPLSTSYVPNVVQARIYYSIKNPSFYISTFLSYPKGMSILPEGYFWEIYNPAFEDVERFYNEVEMEERIVEILEHING